MKKITLLLILFLVSKINTAQLIYDKWPQVYSFTTAVTNKISNIYGTLPTNTGFLMFQDTVNNYYASPYKTSFVRSYNASTNSITDVPYAISPIDSGFTSMATAQTNTPGLNYTYFSCRNPEFGITSYKNLYKYNSQTGNISVETHTTTPFMQFGYGHLAFYSPTTNNDSLAAFEYSGSGSYKVYRKHYNQTGILTAGASFTANSIIKSIVYKNKLFLSAIYSGFAEGVLYVGDNNLTTFTINPFTSTYLSGFGDRFISDMDTLNGDLYLSLSQTEGYYDIYKTNDGVSYTAVTSGSLISIGKVVDMLKFKNKLWCVIKNKSGGIEYGERPGVGYISNGSFTLGRDTLGNHYNIGESFRLAAHSNSLFVVGDVDTSMTPEITGTRIYRLKYPTAQYTPTASAYCFGKTYTLTNTSTEADSVRWFKNGNYFLGTGNTFTTNFSTAGSNTIGLIAITGTIKDTIKYVVNANVISSTLTAPPTICESSPFNISANISGATTPNVYSWTKYNPAPTTTVASTQNLAVTTITNGAYSYSFSVTDALGCNHTNTISINVNSSKFISATVHHSLAPVSGSVTLYRYEPILTKFDSISTEIINGVGQVTFNSIPTDTYILLAIPVSNTLQPTYGYSAVNWKTATNVIHGCIASSNQTISVLPITNLGGGPGVLTGKITEGIGYGSKGTMVPGGPIKGVLVKGGRNPGGDIVAQGRTQPNGTYTLSGLPLNASNEEYFVIVDIPGLDTNGTYRRIITGTNTIATGLDFVVDSAKINPTNTVGMQKINFEGLVIKTYPNPAKDYLKIVIETKQENNIMFSVSNIWGQNLYTNSVQVGEQKEFVVNTTNWLSGVYFIKYKIENYSKSIKIVIE
ncbi:MAG: T9SS type A sorting domain-containing protein [Bacteroidetes bacterium]|nr:T9SS type A sorting domain-containing protein [Bacteroidota bacterium]